MKVGDLVRHIPTAILGIVLIIDCGKKMVKVAWSDGPGWSLAYELKNLSEPMEFCDAAASG
jgi:hypothetical protein